MQNSDWKQKFIFIFTGQFLSLLTSTIVNFAIILWLSIHTGSAQVLAFAAIASLLPQSLLGLFTGVFIDRWNRKLTMIAADLFIAFCTLVIALILYLNIEGTGYIYLLLALRSAGNAFHMPALQASIPMLAPQGELTRIAGINQVIQSVCQIAGPALGALFITIMEIEAVLLIDAAGAAAACISLLFVSIPDPERKEKTKSHFRAELKEAVTVIMNVTGLKWLFLFSLISTFCIMPIAVMFPLMTLHHFSGNAFQVSLIEILWGIGMLAGGAIMGIKKYSINEIIIVNSMYILLGLSFMLSGFLPKEGFILFTVLTIIGGTSGSVYYSAFTAIIQKNLDPAVMGRVFSMYFSITLLPSLLGLTGTGFIADTIGIAPAFIILGIMILLVGVVSFFVDPLYKLGTQSQSA